MEYLCLMLFLYSIIFLPSLATDNQDFFLVSTTERPSSSEQQSNKFVKNEEPTCAAQIQNSYLLEVIKLQNNQILSIIEREIKIQNDLQNISNKQLQEVREQIYPEINKIQQHTQHLSTYETLLKSQTSNTCSKQQLEEAKLHIVSAVKYMVNQKLDDHDIKLQKTIKEILLRSGRVETQMLKQQTNIDYLKTHLVLQKRILEENNEKLQSIEKHITEIQQNLVRLRNLPRDCREIQNTGNSVSGIYEIQPEFASKAFMVLCDMKTKGGGWVYVMNRFDGSQNFNLNWTDYKLGFGKLTGEYWLGLEHLYELTGHKMNELLIELVDWDNKTAHAHYTSFSIGKEEESYPLKILKGYSGDAKDSFSYHHLNMNFSTADHNKITGVDCASYFQAGWWYNECYTCLLTGTYIKANYSSKDPKKSGVHWAGFRPFNYSLKEARMMIRPHSSGVLMLPHEKIN